MTPPPWASQYHVCQPRYCGSSVVSPLLLDHRELLHDVLLLLLDPGQLAVDGSLQVHPDMKEHVLMFSIHPGLSC